MNNIIIRKADSRDLNLLQSISTETFVQTFAEVNTMENMNKYLAERLSLSQLAAELNDPHAAFYFAILNDQVIGYLKTNTGAAQTELKEQDGLEVERIYVLKEFKGKNIGRVLLDRAIEIAIDQKAAYIWLGVWEENYRAIRFYEKNGFSVFDRHIFKLGNDEQTDLMMKRTLR
ncbi:MAG TPA: GNAT family N-acetyltransferase [Sediminibacterium sp.]|nr:GNAT family N-acetyltransferase [Sediminibacterium sp.]